LGAAGMTFLGALSPRQVYESIDWRVVVLIAGMLPLGTALQKTGAAELLSGLIVAGLAPLVPRGVLLAVAGLALLLAQVMHNAAVAVVVAPIAIDAAASLQSNPKALSGLRLPRTWSATRTQLPWSTPPAISTNLFASLASRHCASSASWKLTFMLIALTAPWNSKSGSGASRGSTARVS